MEERDLTDGRHGLWGAGFADLREMGARYDNGQSVICVNLRNLRTIEKNWYEGFTDGGKRPHGRTARTLGCGFCGLAGIGRKM
jgi:hypothetical protein